jgi:hypothetical protein
VFRGALSAVIILVGLVLWNEASSPVRSLWSAPYSTDRSRLIATIAREQDRLITNSSPNSPKNLNQWILNQWFRYRTPSRLIQVVEEAALQNSSEKPQLERWKSVLSEWSAESNLELKVDEQTSSQVPSSRLLSTGRLHVFRAEGERRAGAVGDASLQYIWGIYLLSQYVERAPSSESIPEALYLLGVSYLALRDSLPNGIRGDRLINLCAELYPGTIWGREATRVWKEEMGSAHAL